MTSERHYLEDAILNLIGAILRNTPEVNAYRIGGDEFTLLLPHGSESSIGERIRDKVGHSVLNFEGTKLSVSISIGIATRKAGDSMESLLCRADEALYEAKDAGGNQVCCRTSG